VQTFAIVQHKGGVGKTTVAVNLAANLADAGRRVLLIDLDPQASASAYLNVSVDSDRPHLADLIERRATLDRNAYVDVEAVPRLSMIPGDLALSGVERELTDAGRLRDVLTAAATVVDTVVIDSAPGWSMLTVNALVAARRVIAPVETKHLSLHALLSLDRMVADVNHEHSPRLSPAMIVPTRVQRTRMSRECLEDLQATFGDRVLPPIRESARVAESSAYHLPVARYAPDSIGAEDFAALTAEILTRCYQSKRTATYKRQHVLRGKNA